jgi:hypothetical protein
MKIVFWIVKVMVIVWLFLERIFVRAKKKMSRKDWTTYGDFFEKHRRDSKKLLIKSIANISGLINDNPGNIDKEFYQELRQQGKKALLKTLCLLHVAYTQKQTGKVKEVVK